MDQDLKLTQFNDYQVFRLKEFKQLLEPEPEEYQALKESISKTGVRVPLLVYRDGRVLDGNTRLSICKELGIQNVPVTAIMATLSEEELVEIAFEQQFARRKYPDWKRDMQIFKLFTGFGYTQGRPKKSPRGDFSEGDSRRLTRQDIAKLMKISSRTVDRALYKGRKVRQFLTTGLFNDETALWKLSLAELQKLSDKEKLKIIVVPPKKKKPVEPSPLPEPKPVVELSAEEKIALVEDGKHLPDKAIRYGGLPKDKPKKVKREYTSTSKQVSSVSEEAVFDAEEEGDEMKESDKFLLKKIDEAVNTIKIILRKLPEEKKEEVVFILLKAEEYIKRLSRAERGENAA